MNLRSSSWTGRSARDMRSAFGPYTDDALQPMPERSRLWQDWCIYVMCCIAVAVIIYF